VVPLLPDFDDRIVTTIRAILANCLRSARR
jgi:hypothetical protein